MTYAYLIDRNSQDAADFRSIVMPVMPKNNRFATYGDSRMAANWLVSGSDRYKTNYGIGYWLESLSRGAVRFLHGDNFAVSGANSEDALLQLPSILASTVDNVLMLVSTNDRPQDKSLAFTIGNLIAALDVLVPAKSHIWILCETPRGTSGFSSTRLTSTQLARHRAVVEWLRRYVPAHYGCNVHIVDSFTPLADLTSATGDIQSAYTYDGLHLNPTGVRLEAAQIAADPAFKALYPAQFFLPSQTGGLYDATENPYGPVTLNPQMVGSASTITNWSVGGNAAWAAGTAMTSTVSFVTTSTGNWAQVAISGTTAANSSPTLFIAPTSIVLSKLLAGDKTEAVGEWEIDAGQTGIVGLFAENNRSVSGVYNGMRSGHGNATTGLLPATADSGIFRTDPLDITGTESTSALSIAVLAKPSTVISATIRLRNCCVQKVAA